MTKTTNYQLPKWEKTDRVQMKDFNDMTAALDAALGTIPKLAVGSYTGDGAESRKIDLGFTPRAVFVCNSSGLPRSDSAAWGGVALPDLPALYTYSTTTVPVVSICEGGFTVYYRSFGGTCWVGSNGSGSTLVYFALR